MSEGVQAAPGSKRRVPRTRGAASGLLLMLLGAWGAIVPFIGPYFSFAFTPSPNTAWDWTAARGWYEVLPGCVAFVGGLLLLLSTSRMAALLGAWLGIAAGAWFIIGPPIANEVNLGSLGAPAASSSGVRTLEVLAYFYLLGAVILFLASAAFGRLSVVSLRDLRVAERREAARIEAEDREAAARTAAQRDTDAGWGDRDIEERRAAEQAAAERDAANRDAAERHAAETGTGTGSGTGESYGRHESDTGATAQYPSGYTPPPAPPPGR